MRKSFFDYLAKHPNCTTHRQWAANLIAEEVYGEAWLPDNRVYWWLYRQPEGKTVDVPLRAIPELVGRYVTSEEYGRECGGPSSRAG